MMEENENIYPELQERIAKLESAITPIVSKALNSETPPPSGHVVSKEISRSVDHMENLLITKLNEDRISGRPGTHHLKEMFHRVQVLKKSLKDWPQSQPSSSSVVSSEPPKCPNTDSSLDEDYDSEEGNEVNNYDREEMGEFSLVGFKVHDNLLYDQEDENSDDVMGFEGVGEDAHREETISKDNEKMECISDDRDGGIKDGEEIINTDGRNKEKLKKAGGGKTKVKEVKNDYYCYKVAFWILVFILGAISVITVFSDFTDYHSPAVFPTPT